MDISPTTFRNWREQGEADADAGEDTPFSDFFLRSRKAQAQAEQKALRIVLDASVGGQKTTETVIRRKYLVTEEPDPDHGPGNEDARRRMETDRLLLQEESTTTVKETLPDARAAMWFLERRNRKEYGRTVGVVGADGEGPVKFERVGKPLEQLDDASLDQLEALLAGAATGTDDAGGRASGEGEAGGPEKPG